MTIMDNRLGVVEVVRCVSEGVSQFDAVTRVSRRVGMINTEKCVSAGCEPV